MLLFWLLVSVMLLTALSLVLVPLVRATGVADPVKRPWPLILLIGVLIPVSAIYLYLKWGDSEGLKQAKAMQALAKPTAELMASLKTPEQVIEKLQQRIATEPNNPKGWFLLGRLYFSFDRFAQAEDAFAHAYALQKDNINIMTQYAQASFFAHGKALQGVANTLIAQVLQRDPDNEAAINLLAINAYQAQHYQEAIAYWEKLLPHHSAQSEDGKVLLDAIATAQKALAKT